MEDPAEMYEEMRKTGCKGDRSVGIQGAIQSMKDKFKSLCTPTVAVLKKHGN